MTRLVFILVCSLLGSALDANQCRTLEDHYYAVSDGSNWLQFTRDLKQTMTPWKAKLITRLLKSYAEDPHIDFRHYDAHGIRARQKSSTKWPHLDIFLPYAISAPKTVIDAYVDAARIKGLKPGHQYVVLPSRLILANATKSAYTHLFSVLSFGALGQVLDAVGLGIESFILEYGNEEDLKENEIILHVLTDPKPASRNDDPAGFEARALILKQLSKKQWLLDLGSDEPTATVLVQKVDAFIQEKLKNTSIRVKRVVTSSHGAPGRIFFGGEGVLLSVYAILLSPLIPYFSDRPEFYFEGCNLAVAGEGERQLIKFAKALQKNGVLAEANRVYGSPGFSMKAPLDFVSETDRIIDTFFLVHPFAYGVYIGYGLLKSYIGSAYSYKTGPLYMESARFSYKIPSTQ